MIIIVIEEILEDFLMLLNEFYLIFLFFFIGSFITKLNLIID